MLADPIFSCTGFGMLPARMAESFSAFVPEVGSEGIGKWAVYRIAVPKPAQGTSPTNFGTACASGCILSGLTSVFVWWLFANGCCSVPSGRVVYAMHGKQGCCASMLADPIFSCTGFGMLPARMAESFSAFVPEVGSEGFLSCFGAQSESGLFTALLSRSPHKETSPTNFGTACASGCILSGCTLDAGL